MPTTAAQARSSSLPPRPRVVTEIRLHSKAWAAKTATG